MTDTAVYGLLFFSAFTSATLLPGSSEATLAALLATGQGAVLWLFIVATTGNVLGSVVNWLLGRFFVSFRDRRWFPVTAQGLARAEAWFARYGVWALLLSWLPVIGDPITVVAGTMRINFLRFVLLVSLAKAGRYLFVVGAVLWWQGA